MKPLYRQFLRLAFALAVLIFASYALISYIAEPRYKGRSFTSWLREYEQNLWDESESARAILAIGTNAAPTLAKMVLAQESFSLARVAKKLRIPIEFLASSEPYENHRLAMNGFRLLGPTASNALPFLSSVALEPDAYYAYEAIQAIGQPALPLLNQMLSTTNHEAKRYAVWSILNINFKDFGALSNLLIYPDPQVRGEAYLCVPSRHYIPQADRLEILLRGIGDPQTFASQRAVLGLRQLGLYATNALPRLYELQSTTNARLAQEITTTIQNIEKRVRIEQTSMNKATALSAK
ncbi:MAG TPA: hypothetical protein VF773_12180 [Verrucomicrobiae bacterium]